MTFVFSRLFQTIPYKIISSLNFFSPTDASVYVWIEMDEDIESEEFLIFPRTDNENDDAYAYKSNQCYPPNSLK